MGGGVPMVEEVVLMEAEVVVPIVGQVMFCTMVGHVRDYHWWSRSLAPPRRAASGVETALLRAWGCCCAGSSSCGLSRTIGR